MTGKHKTLQSFNEHFDYFSSENLKTDTKKGLLKKSEMSHIQGTDNEDVYEFPDLSGTQKMAYFWLTKKSVDVTK